MMGRLLQRGEPARVSASSAASRSRSRGLTQMAPPNLVGSIFSTPNECTEMSANGHPAASRAMRVTQWAQSSTSNAPICPPARPAAGTSPHRSRQTYAASPSHAPARRSPAAWTPPCDVNAIVSAPTSAYRGLSPLTTIGSTAVQQVNSWVSTEPSPRTDLTASNATCMPYRALKTGNQSSGRVPVRDANASRSSANPRAVVSSMTNLVPSGEYVLFQCIVPPRQGQRPA